MNCRFQTFAVLRILYMSFWVFPRRHIVVVVGRRFGTLCQFHLPRLDVDCKMKSLKQKFGLFLNTPCSYRLLGAACCFIFSSRFGLMLYSFIKLGDRHGPFQTAILLHIRLQTLVSGDNHLPAVSKKSNIMEPAGFQVQVRSSPSNPLLTMTSIKFKAHKHTHTHTHTHTLTQLYWNSAQAIKVCDLYSGVSRSEYFMRY
jgi:hypothetical protein